MPIKKRDIIYDIQTVAEEVDDVPTLQQYRDHGSYSVTTLYDRFESWQTALEASGFDSRDPQTELSREELLDELERLAEDLGREPTPAEMDELGEHWVSTYQNHFGTWVDAIEEAGLEPAQGRSARSGRVSEKELLSELERIGEKCGPPPSFQDMETHGKYGARTYVRRFGSWNEAVSEAGFEPADQDEKLSKAEMVAELHRLRDELGEQPISTDVVEHGRHSLRTYQRRFGSWSAAVEAAFGDENELT